MVSHERDGGRERKKFGLEAWKCFFWSGHGAYLGRLDRNKGKRGLTKVVEDNGRINYFGNWRVLHLGTQID